MAEGMNDQLRLDLLRLRDLAERTGVKHELQCMQLNMWGFVVWPSSQAHVVEWDYPKREVRYQFRGRIAKLPKDFDERKEALNAWVKELLGDKYVLVIKHGEEVLFRGKRGPIKKKKAKNGAGTH